MLCARGQRLLMMDADGATKVSDLERLEAKLAEISSELCGCMDDCIDQCSGVKITSNASWHAPSAAF